MRNPSQILLCDYDAMYICILVITVNEFTLKKQLYLLLSHLILKLSYIMLGYKLDYIDCV
jgi:hypothetical protein